MGLTPPGAALVRGTTDTSTHPSTREDFLISGGLERRRDCWIGLSGERPCQRRRVMVKPRAVVEHGLHGAWGGGGGEDNKLTQIQPANYGYSLTSQSQ